MTAALSLPPFYVRPETPDDRSYIHASWHRSVCEPWDRPGGGGTRHVEGAYLYRWQREMITAILARPTTVVEIASPTGDDTIAGWICHSGSTEPMTIYYLFVRPNARRTGLGRMLVGSAADRPVFYAAKPGAERVDGSWKTPSWVTRVIPRSWRHVPRANYHDVET